MNLQYSHRFLPWSTIHLSFCIWETLPVTLYIPSWSRPAIIQWHYNLSSGIIFWGAISQYSHIFLVKITLHRKHFATWSILFSLLHSDHSSYIWFICRLVFEISLCLAIKTRKPISINVTAKLLMKKSRTDCLKLLTLFIACIKRGFQNESQFINIQ